MTPVASGAGVGRDKGLGLEFAHRRVTELIAGRFINSAKAFAEL